MYINSINLFNQKINKTNYNNIKKIKFVPSFCGEQTIKNEISPIYYYNNILYPLEERIYSSRNQAMLERPGDFLINKFENVPCPACGRIMLTRNQFDEFKQLIDNAEPDSYINILEKYKNYMRPIELSVFEEISELSQETGIKDIRKLIEILRQTKLPQLQKIQKQKLKKMKAIAKNLPNTEKKVLSSKLVKLETFIQKKNQEAPFRRKIMIDRISKIKISNKHKYEKLQNIAKSFPTSSDTNSAWIVKYSGKNKQGEPWSSHDIAIRMLEFSVPNTDHILARDKEAHHDDIINYMPMHSGCNSQKSNKSFLHWYNEDRQLRENNLNAYFDKVDELISSGRITDDRYKHYVADATEFISELSYGQYKYKK